MPLTVAAPGGGESVEDYIRIIHREPPNTGGGATLANTWQIRPLNLITDNAAGLASLVGNTITLAAGTYRMRIHSASFATLRMKTRLRDLTNGTIYLGSNTWPPAGQARESWITGKFTIAAAANFVVEQIGRNANPIYGWGKDVPNTGLDMVYCSAEFFRSGA